MEQKKFVKVGFTIENMRLYVGMIEEEIEQFINHDPSFATYQKNDVKEWGSFDASKIMQEITILTASRTLQGKEVRDSLDKGYAELFNDLDAGFTPLNFMFPNLPLESYRRRDRAHTKMSQFYVNLIQKRRNGDNDVRRLSSWPKIFVFQKIFFYSMTMI
jgi:sterol 14alpha-demethylase